MYDFLILLVTLLGIAASIGLAFFAWMLTQRFIADQHHRWCSFEDGGWNARSVGYMEEHHMGEDNLTQWMCGTEGGLTGALHRAQYHAYIARRWWFGVRYDAWEGVIGYLARRDHQRRWAAGEREA